MRRTFPKHGKRILLHIRKGPIHELNLRHDDRRHQRTCRAHVKCQHRFEMVHPLQRGRDAAVGRHTFGTCRWGKGSRDDLGVSIIRHHCPPGLNRFGQHVLGALCRYDAIQNGIIVIARRKTGLQPSSPRQSVGPFLPRGTFLQPLLGHGAGRGGQYHGRGGVGILHQNRIPTLSGNALHDQIHGGHHAYILFPLQTRQRKQDDFLRRRHLIQNPLRNARPLRHQIRPLFRKGKRRIVRSVVTNVIQQVVQSLSPPRDANDVCPRNEQQRLGRPQIGRTSQQDDTLVTHHLRHVGRRKRRLGQDAGRRFQHTVLLPRVDLRTRVQPVQRILQIGRIRQTELKVNVRCLGSGNRHGFQFWKRTRQDEDVFGRNDGIIIDTELQEIVYGIQSGLCHVQGLFVVGGGLNGEKVLKNVAKLA
mmetsp:Transcript_123208/g.184262  ORF Transcript_123208/g.184262 Transcript_123208/m.184262 type:complete len:418 (+) Transcript_123208:521-1774(+)